MRRDTHGMSLTQTGQRLLVDARIAFEHAEEVVQRIHEQHQTTLCGHLRLFATVDLGQSYFAVPYLTKELATDTQA